MLDSAAGAAVRAAATGSRTASFVDGRAVLAGPDGGYTDFLPGPDGAPRRVRKADGVHFCPAGAARLASAVIRDAARRWQLTPRPDWEAAAWRADGRYAPDKGCAADPGS